MTPDPLSNHELPEPVLAGQMADLLQKKGWFLATAESCTGGLVAAACTELAGSSNWFERGFVPYSNAAKTELLDVDAALIAQHGAVSEPVARAMAAGALSRSQAQVALAVTGVAGPTGGSPLKPVGTVWIGLATARETQAEKKFNPVDRETFKYVTAQQAMEMLRRELVGVKRET